MINFDEYLALGDPCGAALGVPDRSGNLHRCYRPAGHAGKHECPCDASWEALVSDGRI